MYYRFTLFRYHLKFRQPAGTSRGVYTERKIWYILLTSDRSSSWGVGECAPLPDLSIDAVPDYDKIVKDACCQLARDGYIDKEALRSYPSVLFGLETALRHFEQGSFALWDTPFSRGEEGITINGLIWMGDKKEMLSRIDEKLKAGYRCIKVKIGAIDFEEELELLRYIRRHYPPHEIEIRVDANGAFKQEEALDKLNRLAGLGLHSIEQPIRAGQWKAMACLCSVTPLPIALDEELIGNFTPAAKRELLETIRPQYIILKPSLHGGLSGCKEWIEEAERLRIGWWVTSALESNIGLNAIAQWCATQNNQLPQGLGTGKLFTSNWNLPLQIHGDKLWFDTDTVDSYNTIADLPAFLTEWYNDSPSISLQTSGSTGTPKMIEAKKSHMLSSAEITCDHLRLKAGDKALLCMPLTYIAGKMMVVRALSRGLILIVNEASSHPLSQIKEKINFAAMTPMQVYNSLQLPEERERLKNIDKLIIGGGPLDPEVEKELRNFPNEIYATYGMTETVSHIALRVITGKEASSYYIPFSSVKLSLSSDNTLIIDAPRVSEDLIHTNDIAELLPDGRFRILGRSDNVINSGGIKIIPEELEERLRSVISVNFAITSVSDKILGEAIVLLTTDNYQLSTINQRSALANYQLPRYHRPKYIFRVEKIPQTGNGKTDRAACRRLAEECICLL